MTEKDLLHILDKLGDDDFSRFKWYLKYEKVGDIEPIKECQLSNAKRQNVVDLMVQKYESAGAMKVFRSILKNLNRKDLVRKVPNIDARAEGLGMDLPSPMDAVEIEDTKMPVQRCHSLPDSLFTVAEPLLTGSKLHLLGLSFFSSTSQCDNKENMPEEGFQFKTLTKPVSQRRVRSFNSGQSKDAFAHHPSSAPARSLSSPCPVQQFEVYASSPIILRYSSLPTYLNGDDDDGLLDVFDDNKENDSEMPMGMASLLTAPLVADSIAEDSPVIHRRPWPSPVSRPPVKRPDHPGDENTPVRVKRRRSLAGTQVTTTEQDPESLRKLHLLGLSPSLKGQETDSHHYGISGQQPSQITASSTSQCDNKENMPEEGFQFKTPTKTVSQSRVRSFNSGQSKDAFAHRSSSAPARSPVIRCRPRNLFCSLYVPIPVTHPSVKRPDHPGDENTQCSLGGTQVTTTEQDPESPRMIDATNIDFMDEDTCGDQTVVTLSPELKEVYADALSDASEVMFGPFLKEPMASQRDDTIHQPSLYFEENEPAITSITLPPTSTALTTPDTAAIGDESSSSTASYDVCVTIKLHRVILLEEMISKFKDPELLKHPLRYINIDEKGADIDGVSRDVYSAFWTEFMNHTAEGEDLRVPSLSLKWQEEEWKSIGRILLKGFQDHGYFPCRLAPVFTMALIFGENEVSDDMLFESLLLYISQSDRDLITTALKEDLLDEDRDDLLDLLNRFNVTALPTQENLKGILLKVAHKQLIQTPRYAAEKMALVASNFLKEAFVSPQDVLRMYEDKKPTTRKLLKLLDASPTTQAENQSFRFLQQYIRGLDDTGLRRMLRFVTGSDVICVNKVEVLFTPVDGLARRPVAHTCGPALELPSTYTSYPELRTEMENILVPESCDRFSIA